MSFPEWHCAFVNAQCPSLQDIEVAFRGIEMGSLEALLKAASPGYKSRPYSSGLEDSAVGGVPSTSDSPTACTSTLM